MSIRVLYVKVLIAKGLKAISTIRLFACQSDLAFLVIV